MSFTWQSGRQLQQTKVGNVTTSYTYNPDGIRIRKTVGGTKTDIFVDDSGTIHGQKTGNNVMTFLYDATGRREGFTYNNISYYYVYNAQGDVTGIVNKALQSVVLYTYDAWGRVVSVTDGSGKDVSGNSAHIGNLNPFRYRRYYYDVETGLYYLNSRYYDPVVGRFVNADTIEILDGGNDHLLENNLFAYCFNNPVNMVDEEGTWPSWATKVLIGVAVIAVCAVVTVATGGTGAGVAGFIAAGALKGAVVGGATGAVFGAGAIGHRTSTGSWRGAGKAALDGGASGFMSGAITGAATGALSSTSKVLQASRSWSSGTFKSPVKSMDYHYKRHVVEPGLANKNNIIRYTNNAVSFMNKNSSYLKYNYSQHYKMVRWSYSNPLGGGLFTTTGKLISFWPKG